jgi:uncharacterized protein YuzB (UPF0349 family)
MCEGCNDEIDRLKKEGKCDICQGKFSEEEVEKLFFSPELAKTELAKGFQKLINLKKIEKNLGIEEWTVLFYCQECKNEMENFLTDVTKDWKDHRKKISELVASEVHKFEKENEESRFHEEQLESEKDKIVEQPLPNNNHISFFNWMVGVGIGIVIFLQVVIISLLIELSKKTKTSEKKT